MTHDTTGRYWRFDTCGHCNNPECCEGDSVDVSEEIASLRAERDEANERIALLVQKYEHEAKQLEAERDVMHAKLIAYEKTDRKLCAAIVRLQRELDALQMKYTDECFENERMRGVVEAAVEWIESWGCDSPDTKDEELALAIKAYRAASSEANGISKLDPNSASSKQPHNPHRNIATNNPERNETDPAITSSTQDSNTDTDRDTGHNDE